MPSSGRENLGWAIGNKDIGVDAVHRGRTDVVLDQVAGRPLVFFDIAIDGAPAGRMVCELFNDVVPRTAENFRSLCTGIRGEGRRGKPLHFKGVPFHRIIPNFMIQGGDITHGDGSGGESIFGQTFPDENLQLKHTSPGILSMANSGKNTNGSQFFVCTKACPHLDGKHVVFGRVRDGMDVVHRMEACGQESGTPTARVVVDDCGELKGVRSGDPDDALVVRPGKKRRAADAPSKVHVIHILKKHSASSDPNSRGKAVTCTKSRAKLALTNIRKRLAMMQGQAQHKFVELAREHSDCETAQRGGDLGLVTKGTLAGPVEDSAFSLSVGEISEPFESEEGIHLVMRVS
mmetsp:Transcript_52399/g.113547  ORF Transcript_52399/g.113547 Transcript_52399/m.113547 type:complete len:347 (+) Transcript_52399:97-1137(+)